MRERKKLQHIWRRQQIIALSKPYKIWPKSLLVKSINDSKYVSSRIIQQPTWLFLGSSLPHLQCYYMTIAGHRRAEHKRFLLTSQEYCAIISTFHTNEAARFLVSFLPWAGRFASQLLPRKISSQRGMSPLGEKLQLSSGSWLQAWLSRVSHSPLCVMNILRTHLIWLPIV